MTIGGNLKKLRVAQGLTQDQLAEKLHVTRQAVSNWERNVSHPDLDQLEAIAAALGVEVTTLLYGPPQPYRPSRKRVGVTVGLAAAAAMAGWSPGWCRGTSGDILGMGCSTNSCFSAPCWACCWALRQGACWGCGSP